MFAKRFLSYIDTDPNSVHHGRALPAEGVAVDEDGNIYKQTVTDRLWWDWEWEKTGSVKLPKALKNAIHALNMAFKGWNQAVTEDDATHAAFIEIAKNDPNTRWWPGGATPSDLSNPALAKEWKKKFEDVHKRVNNLKNLMESISQKCDKIAIEKGIL